MTFDQRIPQPGDPDYDPGAFQQPTDTWYGGPANPITAIPPAGPTGPGNDPNHDPGAFQRPPGEPPMIHQPDGSPGGTWVPDPAFLPGGPQFDAGVPSSPRVPEPPRPGDVSGFMPIPPQSAMGSPVPRVSGNSLPQSPRSEGGFRPQIPVWARGLARSPYARFLARGGENPYAVMPGFSADMQEEAVPVEDEESRRRREMEAAGTGPAWFAP